MWGGADLPGKGRDRIDSVGCELFKWKHVINVVYDIMWVKDVEVLVEVEYDVE